jgi:ABC-type transport system substrate-binding protein
MKRTASRLPAPSDARAAARRCRALFLFPALAIVFFAGADALRCSARPRTGGTLRIVLSAQPESIGPRVPAGDAAEGRAARQLGALVYETLVTLDDAGRPQPRLGVAWEHDAAYRRWTFTLREGVALHGGARLTPEMVAASLEVPGAEVRPAASGDGVVIQCEQRRPALLAELADPRYGVAVCAPEGTTPQAGAGRLAVTEPCAGSGEFRIVEWKPRKRLVLARNEEHWAGRPFLEGVEIELGVAPRDAFIALEIGRADVVELSPSEARRAAAGGRRVWASSPVELLALVARAGRPAAEKAGVREALALSVDRASIHAVLLQRQGEPAAALLPQWLSGYAFLFRAERDLEGAKRARAELAPAPPLVLEYDGRDALERAVAERIVVNGREAGLELRAAEPRAGAQADFRVARLPLGALQPALALEQLAAAAGSGIAAPSDASPAELFEAERRLLESRAIVPLAHVPRVFGLSPRVKNWMPLRTGDWKLADVWLEGPPANEEKR